MMVSRSGSSREPRPCLALQAVDGASAVEETSRLKPQLVLLDVQLPDIDGFDVAVVQHEFGIYGGPDGDEILGVLDALTVPFIVVSHNVLTRPTPHQRQVLEQVTERAKAVVTMTNTARTRLVDGYAVNPEKVVVIPHGAVDSTAMDVPARRRGAHLASFLHN